MSARAQTTDGDRLSQFEQAGVKALVFSPLMWIRVATTRNLLTWASCPQLSSLQDPSIQHNCCSDASTVDGT